MYRIAWFHGEDILASSLLPSLPCEGIEIELQHPGRPQPTVYIVQQFRLLVQEESLPEIAVRALLIPVYKER